MDVAEASVPVEVTDIVSCPPPARVITAVAYAAAYATDLAVGEIQYMTGRSDDDRSLYGGMFWLGDKEVMLTILVDEHDGEQEATAGVSLEIDGIDINWSGWFDPVLEEVTSALVAAITDHIKR